jgi:sucrose-6-phosphate hydrolase SacC (GH32 family)
MFKWEKLGKVFDPTEFSRDGWMHEFAQAPSSLVFDDFVRVYFSCRPMPDDNGQYVSYAAYVDLDKRNLFNVLRVSPRPLLELGAPGTFDEFGTYPISVIREGEAIHAYYAGWTRCESVPFNVAIGYAVSNDGGETFKKIGAGPVLSYSLDEPFILSGPKIRRYNGTWCLWYIAGKKWKVFDGKPEPIYKIRMASSVDGIHWKKLNKDIIPDKLGEDEAQASPDVFFSRGRYHMFFCYRQASDYRRNKERTYRIGYAFSNDLLNWTRDDARVGIDVSDEGWDSEMLAYPHILELDGTVYLLYLGNQVGRFGFGAARLDGVLK